MKHQHKVFISYHRPNDEAYKKRFIDLLGNAYESIIDHPVTDHDFENSLPAYRLQRRIRDNYISDATVTVVLTGQESWKQKHIDWEISASLRDTQYNSHTGLVGILLPTRDDYGRREVDYCTIPPRLYENYECGFAKLHEWKEDPEYMQNIIYEAHLIRNRLVPDNSYPSFKQDISGLRWV